MFDSFWFTSINLLIFIILVSLSSDRWSSETSTSTSLVLFLGWASLVLVFFSWHLHFCIYCTSLEELSSSSESYMTLFTLCLQRGNHYILFQILFLRIFVTARYSLHSLCKMFLLPILYCRLWHHLSWELN